MKVKSETRLCDPASPAARALRRSRKGFTLIELATTIPATLIVLIAIGTVLTANHTFWNTSWSKANLQRDASYAMLKINHHIKGSTFAEAEDEGKAVKIYKSAGWIRFFLEQESNDLKCEIEGQDPETIISGSVEDLIFEVDSNKVKINLILKKGNLETHLVSEVMIRNYIN